MRPAHIHFLVNAPDFEPLVTHVFIEGDKYLKSDAVWSKRRIGLQGGAAGGSDNAKWKISVGTVA
jgi:hypothetical protein